MATQPTIEERVSRLEGGYEHLATKGDVGDVRVEVANVRIEVASVRAEVAELRGEVHALKWAMVLAVSGAAVGLAAIQVVLKYLG